MYKNKGGRPRKEIDKNQFESLCALQCTQAEICSFFDVSEKTLQGWCRRTYGDGFSQVYKEKSEIGKISLRRYQFKLAEKNATMAIFLGKQWLGQRENIDLAEEEGGINVTLTIKDLSEGAPDA